MSGSTTSVMCIFALNWCFWCILKCVPKQMAPLSRNKKRIYAIVHTISLHFAPPMLYVQYKHIYMLGNGGNKLFDYDRLRLIISLRTLCPSISKSLAMSVVHIRSLLGKGTYIVNCNIDSERILTQIVLPLTCLPERYTWWFSIESYWKKEHISSPIKWL